MEAWTWKHESLWNMGLWRANKTWNMKHHETWSSSMKHGNMETWKHGMEHEAWNIWNMKLMKHGNMKHGNMKMT
jgi:hypothetical protein